MREWQDHYSILQIHHEAEPEIIESAYKKLSKKYHPDINKSKHSEETMKKLNRAYEVLKDSEKRDEYHKVWLEKNRTKIQDEAENKIFGTDNEQDIDCARIGLKAYLLNISDRRYKNAYELLSEYDRSRITFEEFVEWQQSAAKLYEIGKFSVEVFKVHKNKEIRGLLFDKVIEFNVIVDEKNIALGKVFKSEFIRFIVFEKGEWSVFLGYENVRPFIEKLKNLENNDISRFEMEQIQRVREKLDMETGLPNMNGLLEEVEKEIARHDRYRNVFSIIICNISNIDNIRVNLGNGGARSAVRQVGEVLVRNLRKVDFVSILEKKFFCIMLPETRYSDALKVIDKISAIMRDITFYHDLREFKVFMNFGASEYSVSFEETVKKAHNNMITSAGLNKR